MSDRAAWTRVFGGPQRTRAMVAGPAPARLAPGMNKLEARYAQHLDLQVRAGVIRSWAYEAVRLRLARLTTYTPDFLVVTGEGLNELHEVKGFLREDASVKLKVAAQMFPMFGFKLVRASRDGGWRVTVIPCDARTRVPAGAGEPSSGESRTA